MVSEEINSMKYRLTGAIVWLALLVIIVPIWYNNPVNFQPEAEGDVTENKSEAVVDKAYTFKPSTASKKQEETVKQATTETHSESKISANDHYEKQVNSDAESTASKITGEWIIRVAAFKKKEDAQALKQRLKYDYDVFIKYFPKSEYYSVRLGPYFDRIEAIKDQKRLESVLRTKSELVKIK